MVKVPAMLSMQKSIELEEMHEAVVTAMSKSEGKPISGVYTVRFLSHCQAAY